MWYLHLQVVSFQHMVVSIKNEDSSLNHLPQVPPFVSISWCMPFMVIDDKGGEIVDKDMKDGKDLNMEDMDKEAS